MKNRTFQDKTLSFLKNIYLQIITVMPIMRTLRQRILSTMMTSRKVRLTPENENSLGLLLTGVALKILIMVSTKGGGSAI